MGFGGAQGMITSLKNNSRRNKRDAFDRWTSSDQESQGIKVEAVSEENLEKIRKKIQRQHRMITIKTIAVITISSVLITLWLLSKNIEV